MGTLGATLPRRLEPPAVARWTVLHTKSRQEKVVARFLQGLRLSIYLPLVERVNLVRGRKIRSNIPLFPGYVFMAGERDDAYRAVATGRVCQIIWVRDQERLLDELRQISDALARGAALYQCSFAAVGVRCRITKGPFEGIEGVISSELGGNRLALLIGTLGQSAILEIDADLLEPVD